MSGSAFTPEQRAGFDRDSYVMIRGLFDQMEVVFAEMDPGDGLFFHCNTLHRSDQNRSARAAGPCCSAITRAQQTLHQAPPSLLHAAVESIRFGDQGSRLKFAPGTQEAFMSTFSNPPELKKKIG